MLATGILFRRNRKGYFSSHARKLQDILMYSLKIEKIKQFTQTELSDWLADDCNSFDFDRNTPKRYRRDKVSREIGALLQPLVELGLISQTGPKHTRNGTNEFISLQYSTSGLLLALIIDSIDLERRIENNRKIYEILHSHYSSNKSSKHQFILRMLTIYHQQDNLDDMTEIVREALEKVDYIPLSDLMDIYEIVKISYFPYFEKANLFIQNFKTALNNLEPFIKNLFLHGIKLEYEASMANYKGLGDPMLYEEYRFELKGNPEETALQARCNICDIVKNLSYMTSDLMIRNLNDKPLKIKCPSCNNVNCLVIPSL